MISTADLAMCILTFGMVALVAFGAARSASRTGRAGLGTAVALAVGMTGWLGLTAFLAYRGVFTSWTAKPPRWPLVPLTAVVSLLVLAQTNRMSQLLAHTPRSWPIAVQTFRVGVELMIFAWHQQGRAPAQITFEGRNFDILVGLSAPLIAWLLGSGRIGARGALVWNVVGLAILSVTVGTVATSTPGPLHLDWPGAPFTAIATWPVIWLPALLLPLAVFFHVVSIRQNVAALRSSAVATPATR